MFSSLAAALRGGPEEPEREAATSSETQQPVANAAKSLWGVASALSATVQQRTAELAASIQDTDWRSELTALQQGLKEDTGELQQRAKAATEALAHRAKTAAEQLPAAVEHLPETGAALQARAAEAGHQLTQAGKSLGNLGQRLVHGTTELFDQINRTIQEELAEQDNARSGRRAARGTAGDCSRYSSRYSRFEADVAAMQRDSGTYCDEPDDADDFDAWHGTFDLAARKRDIDTVVAENTFMSELQTRIVPIIVEYDLFWTRYFYRLHKLEQRHAQFAALTQRAEQGADLEEEVGWGSDGGEDGEAEAAVNVEEQPADEGEPDGQQGRAMPRLVGGAELDASVGAGVAAKEVQATSRAGGEEAVSEHQPGDEQPTGPQSSTDQGAVTASTASENSDGGGMEPWYVVKERSQEASDQHGGRSEVPAAVEHPETVAEEGASNEGPVAATRLPTPVKATATAEDSASLSEFALDGDLEDASTGAAAASIADDSDWGEDAADWE